MSLTGFTAPSERGNNRELYDFTRALAKRLVTGEFTWNAPSCAANTTTDTTLTTSTASIIGLMRSGMVVYVTPPSTLSAGLVFGGAWCAADQTLTLRLGNITAAPIDPSSGTWTFWGVTP